MDEARVDRWRSRPRDLLCHRGYPCWNFQHFRCYAFDLALCFKSRSISVKIRFLNFSSQSFSAPSHKSDHSIILLSCFLAQMTRSCIRKCFMRSTNSPHISSEGLFPQDLWINGSLKEKEKVEWLWKSKKETIHIWVAVQHCCCGASGCDN